MVWDPFGTLRKALWIGGGQWAGKSTVARTLARRYGMTAYHYDYQAAHGHHERRILERVRRGQPAADPDPDTVWVHTTPEKLAADALALFTDSFAWVLDDLRALVSGHPVIAEGWGLRPDLIAPLVDSPRRMIVLVPSPEFRRYQTEVLPRAGALGHRTSDPDRAQRNRLDRDEIVAEDAVRSALRHGIRVITVDGSLDAPALADVVADHFAPYLPAAPIAETSNLG